MSHPFLSSFPFLSFPFLSFPFLLFSKVFSAQCTSHRTVQPHAHLFAAAVADTDTETETAMKRFFEEEYDEEEDGPGAMQEEFRKRARSEDRGSRRRLRDLGPEGEFEEEGEAFKRRRRSSSMGEDRRDRQRPSTPFRHRKKRDRFDDMDLEDDEYMVDRRKRRPSSSIHDDMDDFLALSPSSPSSPPSPLSPSSSSRWNDLAAELDDGSYGADIDLRAFRRRKRGDYDEDHLEDDSELDGDRESFAAFAKRMRTGGGGRSRSRSSRRTRGKGTKRTTHRRRRHHHRRTAHTHRRRHK